MASVLHQETHADGSVTTEARGALWLMGLNRPKKLNGLTPKMFGELKAAYRHLEEDDTLRVGILFAHGDHFTAGLDLPKFAEQFASGADFAGAGEPDAIDPFARFGRPRTKPLITAVRGITFTAGIELMLAGDIVVAAEDCRFAQIEPKRGIMAVGGASFRFVERAGWGNAMKLLLTAEEFDAAEAYRCGLVQDVVPAGRDLDRAVEIAEAIAANAPLAVRATLANARLYAKEGEAAAVAEFADINKKLANTQDFQEGVASFKEKRPPRFEGR